VFLNLEDLHELVPELGGAVAGGKARIPPNGLDVARKVHIVHFKVIACHDRVCNRVKLERIGQFSASCIVFRAEREDQIGQCRLKTIPEVAYDCRCVSHRSPLRGLWKPVDVLTIDSSSWVASADEYIL
jgi:hypothetical protein